MGRNSYLYLVIRHESFQILLITFVDVIYEAKTSRQFFHSFMFSNSLKIHIQVRTGWPFLFVFLCSSQVSIQFPLLSIISFRTLLFEAVQFLDTYIFLVFAVFIYKIFCYFCGDLTSFLVLSLSLPYRYSHVNYFFALQRENVNNLLRQVLQLVPPTPCMCAVPRCIKVRYLQQSCISESTTKTHPLLLNKCVYEYTYLYV